MTASVATLIAYDYWDAVAAELVGAGGIDAASPVDARRVREHVARSACDGSSHVLWPRFANKDGSLAYSPQYNLTDAAAWEAQGGWTPHVMWRGLVLPSFWEDTAQLAAATLGVVERVERDHLALTDYHHVEHLEWGLSLIKRWLRDGMSHYACKEANNILGLMINDFGERYAVMVELYRMQITWLITGRLP